MSAAAAPQGSSVCNHAELVDIFTEDYAVVRQIRADAPPLHPDATVPDCAMPAYITLPPDHILARASIHGCLPEGYEIVEPKLEWFDRTQVVTKEQLGSVSNTQSGTSITVAFAEEFADAYAVVRQIRADAPPLHPDATVPDDAVPTYITLPLDHILARASIYGCLPEGYEIVEPKLEWFDHPPLGSSTTEDIRAYEINGERDETATLPPSADDGTAPSVEATLLKSASAAMATLPAPATSIAAQEAADTSTTATTDSALEPESYSPAVKYPRVVLLTCFIVCLAGVALAGFLPVGAQLQDKVSIVPPLSREQPGVTEHPPNSTCERPEAGVEEQQQRMAAPGRTNDVTDPAPFLSSFFGRVQALSFMVALLAVGTIIGGRRLMM
jgi:hypothetical protein